MRFLFLLILSSILLQGCGCSERSAKGLKVGIDPYWYPINFGAQEPYVNGFTEDLLMEIARSSGIEFEKITASFDNLLEGMKEAKYDAVISALPPYEFNTAKYDFSKTFLDFGPVLIVPVASNRSELSKMGGELVGVIAGDPAVLSIQKYADIVVRNYTSIPDLLNAVVAGEIEGALLNRVPAVSYVADLYAGQLKISSAPLTDAGLRLIVPKDKHSYFLGQFNKGLDQLKKKKKLQTLMRKWNLQP